MEVKIAQTEDPLSSKEMPGGKKTCLFSQTRKRKEGEKTEEERKTNSCVHSRVAGAGKLNATGQESTGKWRKRDQHSGDKLIQRERCKREMCLYYS